MNLLYPDSLYDLDTISCSIFMYFQKDPFTTSLHPTVSMPFTDCDPVKFLHFINDKNPKWKNSYWKLYNSWFSSSEKIYETTKLLQPLHDKKLVKTTWLIYPKNEPIIEITKELISKFGIDYNALFNIINIEHACQELMAHIHYEMFLEIYDAPYHTPTLNFQHRDIDYKPLFDYCDKFFQKYSLEEALVNAYFIRLISTPQKNNILLSNEKLIPFLNQIINNKTEIEKKPLSYHDQIDTVTWEIFRQILSPYIDSFDQGKRIALTSEFISKRNDEIKKLQTKCFKLAENFKGEKDTDKLASNISKHISIYAEADIQELLQIDRKSYLELRDKIFSDEKTWIGLSAFIISTFTDGGLITAGSAIVTLSNLLAKTFKTQQETKKTITQSDYSLIYRLKNY